ncbi:MAG: ParB/RepB/Spo0J family partition protein [Patescibacteria group bacterium]
MLGKGLEALIPPNKGSQGGDGRPPVPTSDQSQAYRNSASLVPHAADDNYANAPQEPFVLFELESHEAAHPGEHTELSLPEKKEEKVNWLSPRSTSRHQPPKTQRGVGEAIFYLEVEKIKPNPQQPRKSFDEDALHDLSSSIREFGILQPLVVTKKEHEIPTGTEVEYELIAGERRLMAAKLAGLERVPAIVRSVDLERERLELAVIENLQREDLNAIEMARAFSRLQDEFRMTQREIAVRLGKSRESVANTLRLLDLPTTIQEAIERSEVTESHGRLLLGVESPAEQERLFRDLIARGMTTRELKSRVEAVTPRVRHRVFNEASLSPELQIFQEQLSSELGAPVKIQQNGSTGKILISFYSKEELNQIINRLGPKERDL